MKSYLKILAGLLIVSLCLGLTGCGSDKDDDEPNSGNLVEQLQGTWVFNLGTVEMMGQKITFDRSQLKDMGQQMGVAGFYDEVLTFSGDRVNGTHYTLDGNLLHFDEWSDYEDVWPAVTVKGNTLTLRYDMNVEGIGAKVTIMYVKQGSRSAAPEYGDNSAGLLRLALTLK